jgi:hypothetical protein
VGFARDLAGGWSLEDADYFAEQATRQLKGVPAWGAAAARLGNKKNRLEFVNPSGTAKRRAPTRAPRPLPARSAPGPWATAAWGCRS